MESSDKAKKDKKLKTGQKHYKRHEVSTSELEIHSGSSTQLKRYEMSIEYEKLKLMFKDASNDTSCSGWLSREQVLTFAPLAPGLFQIGLTAPVNPFSAKNRGGSPITIVYIGHTTSDSTLRETILPILHGFDGSPSDRLSLFLVNPHNHSCLRIRWYFSCCPEELIDECVDEFIATNHYIPRFNTPLDPQKGLWVLEDKSDSVGELDKVGGKHTEDLLYV